jgi:hypothetical protein
MCRCPFGDLPCFRIARLSCFAWSFAVAISHATQGALEPRHFPGIGLFSVVNHETEHDHREQRQRGNQDEEEGGLGAAPPTNSSPKTMKATTRAICSALMLIGSFPQTAILTSAFFLLSADKALLGGLLFWYPV